MKEKPILFSTDMVRAILDGKKTQTRRLVKHVKIEQSQHHPDAVNYSFKQSSGNNVPKKYLSDNFLGIGSQCPYGQPGDVLWVREEHLITFAANEKAIYVQYKDGKTLGFHKKELSEKTWRNLKKRKTIGQWQRARFMPKDICRIWLQNESSSVERVQDITEQDAIAEGVELNQHGLYRHYYQPELPAQTGRESFRTLWQSINGPDSWAHNPLVWVVKFKVLSTTGKPQNLINQ